MKHHFTFNFTSTNTFAIAFNFTFTYILLQPQTRDDIGIKEETTSRPSPPLTPRSLRLERVAQALAKSSEDLQHHVNSAAAAAGAGHSGGVHGGGAGGASAAGGGARSVTQHPAFNALR